MPNYELVKKLGYQFYINGKVNAGAGQPLAEFDS